MKLIIIFLLLSFASKLSLAQRKECVTKDQLTFDDEGNVGIQDSLVTCLKNIKDPLLSPMMRTGKPVYVNVTFYVNNLVFLNEIENSVTVDFFLSLDWEDSRLYMPALFNSIKANDIDNIITTIELTQMQGGSLISGDDFKVWQPLIAFPEATSQEETDFYLRIDNKTRLTYLSHRIMTFIQTDFDYHKYPDDEQTVTIRFFPFLLTNKQLKLQTAYQSASTSDIFGDTPAGPINVTFFYDPKRRKAIEQNSIWTYKGMNMTIQDEQFHPNFSKRSTATVTIKLGRISKGIVLRLALPMFLLTILAATSFWSELSERIGTTMTLLLSVSALYIVVFQSVPMIGYLTVFDSFVVALFVILFVCCNLHGFTIRLQSSEKLDKWPLRKFFVRLLELVGRVVIIPVIMILYLESFPTAANKRRMIVAWITVVVFIVFISFRELTAVNKVLHGCLDEVGEKIKNLERYSTFEVWVLNMYLYFSCSVGVERYLREVQAKRKVDEVLEMTSIQHAGHNAIEVKCPINGKSESELNGSNGPATLHQRKSSMASRQDDSDDEN